MLTPQQVHGADRSWRGRFRIYYNSRAAAPYVWAIDDGGAAGEVNVMMVHCEAPIMGAPFEGKRDWPEPTVWVEGHGEVKIIDGVAYITR